MDDTVRVTTRSRVQRDTARLPLEEEGGVGGASNAEAVNRRGGSLSAASRDLNMSHAVTSRGVGVCCGCRGGGEGATLWRFAGRCQACRCYGAGVDLYRAHFNPLTIANASGSNLRFIVENHVQQGTVDFNVAVVINETQFPKLVHEKTHARACRANHLRQCLLADFRNDRLGPTFFAKIRQEQKDPR
jgi:hypothetical protein